MSHRRRWTALVLALVGAMAAAAQGQTGPADVARAVLSAYQSHDFDGLARLATQGNREIIAEIARDGDTHPRFRSLFGDDSWRWRGVRDWDGRIRDIRYRGSADRLVAQVKFGELSPREALVVTLEWRDGAWWFEDVNSPNESDYQELRKEP